MTGDKQERIRQRAFELWEQAGSPEGEHEQHWYQATREIEAEDALAGGPTRDVNVNEGRAILKDLHLLTNSQIRDHIAARMSQMLR